MKRASSLISLLFVCYLLIGAGLKSEIFTLYLVRHSEKVISSEYPYDPPLTDCGTERAKHLRFFFEEIQLDAVYSTNFSRTEQTALPTAIAKGLEIQPYSTSDLEEFSSQLLELKQNSLVIGHSNTTGVLAGIIVDQEIGAFEEHIYNRIYQVVVCGDQRQLNLIHTSFECDP